MELLRKEAKEHKGQKEAEEAERKKQHHEHVRKKNKHKDICYKSTNSKRHSFGWITHEEEDFRLNMSEEEKGKRY